MTDIVAELEKLHHSDNGRRGVKARWWNWSPRKILFRDCVSCENCYQPWPCDTIRLLEGESALMAAPWCTADGDVVAYTNEGARAWLCTWDDNVLETVT